MAQNQQSDGSDQRWLASLIETFEIVSRKDVRATPCSRSLLRAAQAHLAAPASAPQAADKRRFTRAA